MNRSENVHTFIACDTPYSQAETVLFGVPFDGTASFRPGTRFGPEAIRTESWGLETYSPYCDRDLTDERICDYGDLELPFGNPVRVLEIVRQFTHQLLEDGKRPFLLGGEHLVTLGAVQAVVERWKELEILHFDAHTDLRDDYLGEKLSHATVMRRIWELVGDGKIHQFGIRSGEREEFVFARTHTDLHPFSLEGLAETVAALKGRPVYVSLDLDVLDPSVLPGTGTPEPGGVAFRELLEAVQRLDGLNLVGIDVNELSPHYDASGASTAAACKIIRELLLRK